MSGLGILRKLREKISPGFRFSRPLVLLQSDDWGRVGIRDSEGREELRAAGLNLGERPYDFYSLETADDVRDLAGMLGSLRDSMERPPCLEMNFVTANVDFGGSAAADFRNIPLKPLAEGLPGRWARPGLCDAYREGIAGSVFSPELHGTTHFCQQGVAEALTDGGERADFLRTLWKAETPYIHWRMPWIGFEFWHPEKVPAKRFIPEAEQERWIDWGVNSYRQFFGKAAVSACAPGYRADLTTHRLWEAHGIRVAQNGPGKPWAPHFDKYGLLHTYRSFDFEPAVDSELHWEDSVKNAATWLGRGLPLIVSIHSINFHSTLAPFRQKTLPMLRDFLDAIKKAFPDLLYINSRQLLELVETGECQSFGERVKVTVTGMREGAKA